MKAEVPAGWAWGRRLSINGRRWLVWAHMAALNGISIGGRQGMARLPATHGSARASDTCKRARNAGSGIPANAVGVWLASLCHTFSASLRPPSQ